MRPSVPDIFLSTASGAGYGLLALLGLGHVTGDWGFGLVGLLLSLILINMGLGRTVSHVVMIDRSGQPVIRQQHRQSARDRLMPILTFLAMTAYGVYWVFMDELPPDWLGWICTACAIVTTIQLAAVQATRLSPSLGARLGVVLDHLLFAWMSGSLFYLMLAGFFRGDVAWAQLNALLAIVVTWGVTLALWRLIDSRKAGTHAPGEAPEGPGYAEIQSPGGDQTDGPGSLGAELLRRHGDRLRGISVSSAGVIPLMLCALALWIDADTLTGLLAGLAALVTYPGVLLRRWLVFDEMSASQTTTYDRRD